MYELDLALNNLPLLICHQTKQNHSKPNRSFGTIDGNRTGTTGTTTPDQSEPVSNGPDLRKWILVNRISLKLYSAHFFLGCLPILLYKHRAIFLTIFFLQNNLFFYK